MILKKISRRGAKAQSIERISTTNVTNYYFFVM